MIRKATGPLIYILLFFLVLSVAGSVMAQGRFRRFGQAVVIPGAERHTVTIHGMQRNYLLYKPASAKLPAPLVMVFHGGGGTAEGTDRVSGGMASLADREGFVVLYPNAIDKHWFDGRPAVAHTNYDDAKFISTVMDSLVADGTADAKRIYACGISNGGFFSQYLSIKLPGRIAAIASVAASVPREFLSMAVQPVPILMILGTADPLVPFDGGKVGGTLIPGNRGEVVPARDAINFWLARNKMSEQATTSRLPGTDADDGTSVSIEQYGSAGSPGEVLFYEIKGGGHTWPGGMQYLAKRFIGPVCKDFSGNEVIWSFFKGHSLSN